MAQVVKYTPKSLYSGYSLLTISEILDEVQESSTTTNTPPQQKVQEFVQIENKPFKISQRKMLRTSKR